MVRLSLSLEKRYRRKDGKYALRISLARNGHTHYISLGVFVKEEDWDTEQKQKIAAVGEFANCCNFFIIILSG